MRNIVNAKNTTVTDGLLGYIEKRFTKFDKYAPNDTEVFTKLEVKDNGNRHKVEVTIKFGKQTLRAEANDTDMYAAIDEAEKIMARLLKKRKEKLTQRRHAPNELPEPMSEVKSDYEIARMKTHELLSMTAQEACEAMEMIGHSFYVYNDVERDRVCAVYVRDGGTYGQLIYG